MKKYIKQISILALFATFTSCTVEDEKIAMTEVGGNVVLTDTKISRLDINNDIKLKVILKEGVTVSKIEVYNNIAETPASDPLVLGDKIGDAVIVDAVATFNSSLIAGNAKFASNQTKASGTIPLAIVTTYSDGTKTSNPFILTVARAIDWKDADGVTSSTSGVTNIKYLDTTKNVNIIRYGVYKKYTSTVVDNVTMQWKKNEAGTYSEGDSSFDIKKGSIDLGELDYSAYGLAVNDTLYYKFTVKSGSQTDYIETAIAIDTQDFDASKSGSLSDDLTSNKFNLAENKNYANTNLVDGEIKFTTSFGISVEGSTSLDFVKVVNPSSSYYADANLFSAEADYIDGTPVNSLTDLAKGDVIIYKIVRDSISYYGLIKIGDVNSTTVNNETVNSFVFTYKEGTILRNNN